MPRRALDRSSRWLARRLAELERLLAEKEARLAEMERGRGARCPAPHPDGMGAHATRARFGREDERDYFAAEALAAEVAAGQALERILPRGLGSAQTVLVLTAGLL